MQLETEKEAEATLKNSTIYLTEEKVKKAWAKNPIESTNKFVTQTLCANSFCKDFTRKRTVWPLKLFNLGTTLSHLTRCQRMLPIHSRRWRCLGPICMKTQKKTRLISRRRSRIAWREAVTESQYSERCHQDGLPSDRAPPRKWLRAGRRRELGAEKEAIKVKIQKVTTSTLRKTNLTRSWRSYGSKGHAVVKAVIPISLIPDWA